MQTRLDGAFGEVERFGHLRLGQSDVVVEYEDRALVGTKSTEAALKLVTIRHRRRLIADGWRRERLKVDFDGSAAATARSIETRVDREPMKPGIESIDVTQTSKVTPGSDVGLLDRVPRELGVPEDEAGDGFQLRDGRADQRGEGVMIASARSLDEFPLVHSHPR